MAEAADLTLFIGRFHILLLHLPIGFLVLAVSLEALALLPRFKAANAANGHILALTVPAALVTAGCGWLLSSEGGYHPGLIWWHQWLGTAVPLACLGVWWLHCRQRVGLYRLSLAGTAILLMAASHFGGSLTHGRDFLTRHAPAPLRKFLGEDAASALKGGPQAGNRREQPAFTAVVAPILDRTCVNCHGEEKPKGRLRVDSHEALLKGGSAGPAVVPGNPTASELLKRILLPPDHDDHMPPAGKPKPTPEEIALLQWWVAAGAPAGKTLAELGPLPPDLDRWLESRP